jgi:hypothetical protein
MSAEDVGAYLLLLAFCWLEDGLPDDPDKLRVMSRLSPEAFAVAWPGSLRGCFYLAEGRWQHKRLDAERAKQRKRSRAMQINGRKGGRRPTDTPEAGPRFKFSNLYVSPKMHRIIAQSVGKAAELDWQAVYNGAAVDYLERGEPADKLDDLKKRARAAAREASGPRLRTVAELAANDPPAMTPEQRAAAKAALRGCLSTR